VNRHTQVRTHADERHHRLDLLVLDSSIEVVCVNVRVTSRAQLSEHERGVIVDAVRRFLAGED
jgi:hypothetical protein